MSHIGPLVSIRAVRKAHGLTTEELAERITELGVPVHHGSIRNIELGHKPVSPRLLNAWAAALNLRPVDVKKEDGLREYLLSQDDVAA